MKKVTEERPRFVFVEREKDPNTIEKEKIVFQGLEIEDDKIYGWDSYLTSMRWVARIDHDLKEIRTTHGYSIPHPYGMKVKKYAEKIDYKFIG